MAVREKQDRQRKQKEQPNPAGCEKDGEPRQRQPVMSNPVGRNRVGARVRADHEREGEQQHDPADRVPRLPESDQHAHGPERHKDQQEQRPERELIRECRQRQHRQHAQDWRIEAFRAWQEMIEPEWANVHYDKPDFQAISYYSAPKEKAKKASVN